MLLAPRFLFKNCTCSSNLKKLQKTSLPKITFNANKPRTYFFHSFLFKPYLKHSFATNPSIQQNLSFKRFHTSISTKNADTFDLPEIEECKKFLSQKKYSLAESQLSRALEIAQHVLKDGGADFTNLIIMASECSFQQSKWNDSTRHLTLICSSLLSHHPDQLQPHIRRLWISALHTQDIAILDSALSCVEKLVENLKSTSDKNRSQLLEAYIAQVHMAYHRNQIKDNKSFNQSFSDSKFLDFLEAENENYKNVSSMESGLIWTLTLARLALGQATSKAASGQGPQAEIKAHPSYEKSLKHFNEIISKLENPKGALQALIKADALLGKGDLDSAIGNFESAHEWYKKSIGITDEFLHRDSPRVKRLLERDIWANFNTNQLVTAEGLMWGILDYLENTAESSGAITSTQQKIIARFVAKLEADRRTTEGTRIREKFSKCSIVPDPLFDADALNIELF